MQKLITFFLRGRPGVADRCYQVGGPGRKDKQSRMTCACHDRVTRSFLCKNTGREHYFCSMNYIVITGRYLHYLSVEKITNVYCLLLILYY